MLDLNPPAGRGGSCFTFPLESLFCEACRWATPRIRGRYDTGTMIGRIAVALVAHQGGVNALQLQERADVFRTATVVAAARGKPLLVVGRPRYRFNNPCSPDGVTLDLDPAVLAECPASGMVGDVREIALPTGSMGAAGVFHVLEHIPTLEDAQAAWRELNRVADEVFVAYPRKAGLWNHLISTHHLWTYPQGQDLLVEERASGRRALIQPDGTALPLTARLV